MVDPGPFGSASVVAFGLVSAVAWGSADFGGGLASRRSTLFGVVLISQGFGMLSAAALAVLRGEPIPAPSDVGWSALSGVLGAIGILGLYGGLAVGRMGVVAPVTGVLAAIVPVVAGIALEGLPPPIVGVGILLAICGVVLVSRVRGEGGGRSGIELAIVGGLALGLFGVTLSRVDDALVFGPLTIVRAIEGATVGLAAIFASRAVRVPGRLLPAVAAVGLLDMTGNAGFLMATQVGPFAVAAVLSSLYPVATIVLATLVVHETVGRSHALGIGLALVAIVLIAAGSAPTG